MGRVSSYFSSTRPIVSHHTIPPSLCLSIGALVFFQLWTHAYIYTAEASAHHAAQTFEAGLDGPGAPQSQRVFHMPSLPSLPSIFHHSSSSSSTSVSSVSAEEDETIPKLKVQATMILLVTVTVLTGITAEWLVDSIDGLTSSGNISREFVALILLASSFSELEEMGD